MKKLSLLALTAMLALGGAAAPALAATGSVAYCNAGGDEAQLNKRADILATRLQLATKPDANISVWGSCLKVMVTDSSGATTVSFYDADSFRLLAEMS